MKKILITGGCGFAGAHVVEHFLRETDWQIIIWDKLTYASSGLSRVKDINAYDDKRVVFFSTDFTRPISEGIFKECKDVSYILHMGAETHVDNSIKDPGPFVYSNVVGTYNMLEFAKKCVDKFAPDEYKFKLQEHIPKDLKISEKERKALHLVAEKLKEKRLNDKELFEEFYNICKKVKLEPKEFFKTAYRVLIGKDKVIELLKKV